MKIFEMVLYSVVNFLPYIFIALYPFRGSLRFSRAVTAAGSKFRIPKTNLRDGNADGIVKRFPKENIR